MGFPIISMVRDYAQNVDIIFGEGALLSAQPKNKTMIVMSTLDPETMNELGKKVEAESKLRLISAAVSGGASGRSSSWNLIDHDIRFRRHREIFSTIL